jgi:hypothetical protein
MFMSRGSYGICVLALAFALALVGAGWAQTAKPTFSRDHAILYKRAVSLLEQADQKLKAGDLAGAKSLVKQSNSLFTLLKKEYAGALTERELSPQEDQQLAINQKLADDTRAQADLLMTAAAAKDKKAQELEAQGREAESKASYRQSKDEYNRAQSLYVRSALQALRNQQMIFRFLAP